MGDKETLEISVRNFTLFPYLFSDTDDVVAHGTIFLRELLAKFRTGEFKHYKFPEKPVRGEAKTAQERNASKSCKSKAFETQHLVLEPVSYILRVNWQETLQTSMENVVARDWKFGQGIEKTDLRSYETLRDIALI